MDESIEYMRDEFFKKVYKDKIRPLSEKFVHELSLDIENGYNPNIDSYSFYYFLVGVLHFCKSINDTKGVVDIDFDLDQIKSDSIWVEATLDEMKKAAFDD
jgi:hypothetical protein